METLLLLAAHPIVHLNAALNSTATVLLIAGYLLIRQRREMAHKWVMLTAFVVSIAFLGCYLWYHYQVGSVEFTHPGPIKVIYLAILITHVLLAMTVPFLAVASIYLGLRATGCCSARLTDSQRVAVEGSYRIRHRKLARWTYPIWLYVSVTGVIVYVMLYHLWPPVAQ